MTTTSPRREAVAELAAPLGEASVFCPRERLALSPRCGFATAIRGNAPTVQDERSALATIVETAAQVGR